MHLEQEGFVFLTVGPALLGPPASPAATVSRCIRRRATSVAAQVFDGRPLDRGNAIAAEVRRTVAPERLLAFEVRDGWEPLARFLAVAVLDEPFPRTNDAAEFHAGTWTTPG